MYLFNIILRQMIEDKHNKHIYNKSIITTNSSLENRTQTHKDEKGIGYI